MASQTIESLQPAMENIAINNENNKNMNNVADSNFDAKWGLPLEEVYKLALRFYKEKDGTKAVQLSYKDRIKLVAYTKQVLYGKYRTDVSPEVGFLDVVGNDRSTNLSEWQAWMSLGDLSRSEAMSEFIKYIDQLCPLFMPYVDAHKAEKEEQLQKQKEEEERIRRQEEEKERKQLEDEVQRRQEDDRSRQIQQEMAIRAALNQQTAGQFKQYAEQQYPGNKEQQEALIVQLQEQHFQQYMQQVYQQQLLHQQQQQQQLQNMTDITQTQQQPTTQQQLSPQTVQGGGAPGGQEVTQVAQAVTGNGIDPMTAHGAQVIQNNISDAHVKNIPADGGEEETEQNLPPIAAASMWTRKDVKEFKESIRKDPDSLIKVGSGETITVRVPTHEDGTCLFWEFATDNYDIGFGVYFEWTIAPNNQVSVHVSESSDEDELDDEEGESRGGDGDVERGKKSENRPPTDEIIPVYRRDCHQEVYCGSHMYPGRGVYLLKFDNSYSLWRSKCLYYRVYYTR